MLNEKKKSNQRFKQICKDLQLNNPAFLLSGGFILLFIIADLINSQWLTKAVNTGFAWCTSMFGPFWQLLLFLTFFIALFLAIGKTGCVKLGGLDKPEINAFKWVSMIVCTLLAGGGVFWAAAEPIAHYVSPSPIFLSTHSSYQNAINALAQSFMHWSFLAWSILGSLTSIVLMYLHHNKGLPLKPRTLLYPVFGARVLTGFWGGLIDACCIVSVAAGTIGPIGFLGLQIGYSLKELLHIPNDLITQSIIILITIIIYTLSALTGMNKGLQFLSRCNVILAVALMVYILIFGPTSFIINGYIQGMGTLIQNFVPMSMYRGNEHWLSQWTVFFWGWFLGYGPMMAIFIARVSRGRTIRQLFIAISIIAPLATCFWFSIVGGTGIALEITHPGTISQAYIHGSQPAALIAIASYLPAHLIITILFLILTVIFIVTTGDSITYTISVVLSGSYRPNKMIRCLWGILMGLTALILISMNKGGIGSLQSFIIITAAPVSLILLPSLWNAPKIANKMLKNQKATERLTLLKRENIHEK
ncbi:glycine/betaine ABC transporter [Francisella halioticida]|uniref:BCCT transporter n=1 Tax=Francisella halioticida TaxID=549298 RepID=A0ABN5ATJ8_9GAMM|nr:BCCT family transporter [Francisella halioticida]ASG67261.1 BCCT transporter [Francisella halioticida]BCD92410.1 glycine/betaine ABC transporter [Francisella halioticida]